MTDIFLTGKQGQSTEQPGAPQLPSIPSPDGTDQGNLDTLNALVEVTRRLAGQNPGNNNLDQGGGPRPFQSRSSSASPGVKPSPKKDNSQKKGTTGRFVEQSRSTQAVTVTDSNSGASVTFNQITKLVMKDTVTNETWEWSL